MTLSAAQQKSLWRFIGKFSKSSPQFLALAKSKEISQIFGFGALGLATGRAEEIIGCRTEGDDLAKLAQVWS